MRVLLVFYYYHDNHTDVGTDSFSLLFLSIRYLPDSFCQRMLSTMQKRGRERERVCVCVFVCVRVCVHVRACACVTRYENTC